MISTELKLEMFEQMSGVKPMACFDENEHLITFVVPKDELGKALGKGAANAAKIRLAVGGKIRMVEYGSTLAEFVKNICSPLKVQVSNGIGEFFGVVTVLTDTYEERGRLIGKFASVLRNNEKIVKHFYPALKEIRVEQKPIEVEL